MLSHVWSSTVLGVDALPIEIETHIKPGLPKYTVVGLPDNAVRESRDRIWAALHNSGLPTPPGAVTVNLAPADVRKEGAAFDLPIAVGLLAASMDAIAAEALQDVLVTGELSLDGSLRPVRGVLPMAMHARAEGRTRLLVPAANAPEAAVVEGLAVYPAGSILDAFKLLSGRTGHLRPLPCRAHTLFDAEDDFKLDFSDVRGQENVKRALVVAAAGGHNVLLAGPPGAGKTMLARRLPSILPPLRLEEALETTKIHSVGGLLGHGTGLVTRRPFRAPHHTISDVGLCGGGTHPRPGEISLAHNGVLFLDELPEFKRKALEVLRQPLEEGAVTISRSRFTVTYPAQFLLVAGMNLCPCGGMLSNQGRTCTCTPAQVQRYLSKISGPLMDRIDLHIEVMPVPFEALNRPGTGTTSAALRQQVMHARHQQANRFRGVPDVHCNARMPARLVRTYACLDEAGQRLMELAMARLGLSARAHDRILKVARTIADLAGAPDLRPEHVSEAIQYRSLDRNRWLG